MLTRRCNYGIVIFGLGMQYLLFQELNVVVQVVLQNVFTSKLKWTVKYYNETLSIRIILIGCGRCILLF